ncbi:MAG: CapA family protein [Dehalococcoidia bacterium]
MLRRLTPAALLAALMLTALTVACSSTSGSTPGPEPTSRAAVEIATSRPETPTPTATPEALKIAFVGDLMLARDVTTLLETEGSGYALERALPLFDGADLVIGNLEGTLTDRGVPLEKTYTFRTPPALVEALAPFDAVSLANNHSTDYGSEGLEDTLAALDGAGIEAFGAGLDAARAEAPAILEARGLRVAILGIDDIEGVTPASEDAPGVAFAPADPALLSPRIEAAADEADFVVLFMHAGTEYDQVPTDRQRALAHAAIEAGADLVIGAHPHVLQPFEEYGDGLIAYSLGNFVFDLDREDFEVLYGPGPFQSAVALVTLRPGARPTIEYRPAFIDVDENRPRPATAEEATTILEVTTELETAQP